MAKPKLSSKTPDTDDTNALIMAHEDLIEHFNNPELPNSHIAIVEIATSLVQTREGGDTQATVVIRHLELLHGADEAKGEELFTKVYRARTGNKSRPRTVEDTPLPGLGAIITDIGQ